MMYTRYLLFFLCFVVVSCGSEKPKDEAVHLQENKFSDPIIQKIYDELDHRNSDSLVIFLDHKNPIYRAEAALAFASIQDSNYLNKLHPLLNDMDVLVQKNAAWAIGQTNHHSSFEVLKNKLKNCKNEVETDVLEAMGKCAEKSDSLFFENFIIKNSNALGFAKATSKLGYRRLITAGTFDNIIGFYPNTHNEDAKILFATAISRSGIKFLLDYTDFIIEQIKNETTTEVLLPLISSLTKINDDESIDFINSSLWDKKNIPDYRITVAFLNVYSKVDKTYWRLFSSYLGHSNENIAMAATRCLDNSNYNPNFRSENDENKNRYSSRVKAKVLAYSLKTSKDKRWLETIKFNFRNSDNYIDKGFFLRAIQYGKGQEKWLVDKMINSGHPLIKTAAAETLTIMNEKGNINSKFDFNEAIIAGFKTNDIGVIATLAMHLASPKMKFKGELLDLSFLDDALKSLKLPKDIETYNEVLKAKSYLADEQNVLNDVTYNHPLDWDHIKSIPRKQRITFLTNKGKITIELHVEDAPGSVSNFIKLAEEGFYNDKFFHRVVPNFVAQTGCYRGDGYGSVDFSIRSEFALHNYSTGAVGMASAGKDTESCQWFITHNPTPFLEGRYTIFGYVIDEDILTLHQIKQGDRIISVQLN